MIIHTTCHSCGQEKTSDHTCPGWDTSHPQHPIRKHWSEFHIRQIIRHELEEIDKAKELKSTKKAKVSWFKKLAKAIGLASLIALTIFHSPVEAANVYNYFKPTEAGAGSVCAATQIWTLNAAGTLVACSNNFTYTDSTTTLQVGSTMTGAAGQIDVVNAAAPTDARKTRLSILSSSGDFLIVPVNDAGTVTTGNSLSVLRAGNAFSGFHYLDSNGQNFSISGSDMTFRAGANTQPLIKINDPGTADALVGLAAWTGAGTGNEGFLTCASAAFSLGAALTNGPANNYCMVSTGDQLFVDAPSNAPLVFGSHGIYYGQLDPNGNWVLDGGQTNVTSATNGFTYLGKTAGVPTGVPANLTGFYATSVPLRYDSTDNRLYAYNSGWKNVADQVSLRGTSASIGGAALTPGVAGCASSAGVTITGAAVGMTVQATPSTYPGDSFYWRAYVSAANTVVAQVCASVAGTPTASTYNIRVLQ